MSAPRIQVQLLVSEWCASCHQAERVWRGVAEERDIAFSVVDMGQPEGRELVSHLRLKTIPALIVDGELKAIGVQSPQEALTLVADAPPRRATAARHIGLGMERSSRIAILAAMGYVALAGAALPVYGGFFAHGAARVVPLHVLTLGFLVFLVFGLTEHMLPRFTGNPIRLGAWTWVQQGLGHAGLWLLGAGLWLGVPVLQIAGASLAWLALTTLALRLWPVLWPRAAAPGPKGTIPITPATGERKPPKTQARK